MGRVGPTNTTKHGMNLRISVAANQGGRRYMEDRVVIHTERDGDNSLKWTFIGVFDGHGGEHASEFVRRNLLENITSNRKFNSDNDDTILDAIREGFLLTHEMMRHVHDEWPYTASGYPSTAGTTCSCVFIRNGKLYTGHVGDSTIFLGLLEDGQIKVMPLTMDHKPESPREQHRITKHGGSTAVKSGVTRVVWKRPVKGYQNVPYRRTTPTESIPFLSVARSLGDLWSYNEDTKKFIVSPEPDVDVHVIEDRDFCLVLASDGMTNVMPSDQAVSIVFQEEEIVEVNNDYNRNHARCLLRSSLQKWRYLRADNITIATVIFDSDKSTFQDSEVLMKLGPYMSVEQALSDKPDSMLHVSNKENVLLCTKRTPIIYSGTKDLNFCRVNYRGPGFRTHEEELNEEKRNLHARNISKRNDRENVEEDVDYDEEESLLEIMNPEMVIAINEDKAYRQSCSNGSSSSSSMMNVATLNGSICESKLMVVPSPSRPERPRTPLPTLQTRNDDIDDGSDDDATPSKKAKRSTPAKAAGGNTVRRVKAEAVRRLRTPKATTSTESLSDSCSPPERRQTRSALRIATESENDVEVRKEIVFSPRRPPVLRSNSPRKPKTPKTTSPATENVQTTPSRMTRSATARLSSKSPPDVPVTPKNVKTPGKLTLSRKRGRAEMIPEEDGVRTRSSTTGVTPAVGGLCLSSSPWRSAPTTPKKEQVSAENVALTRARNSKWSLSKLDTPKTTNTRQSAGPSVSSDGIIRVSEVADEDDDVMAEPPSKIRRIYGFVKRIIGWPNSNK